MVNTPTRPPPFTPKRAPAATATASTSTTSMPPSTTTTSASTRRVSGIPAPLHPSNSLLHPPASASRAAPSRSASPLPGNTENHAFKVPALPKHAAETPIVLRAKVSEESRVRRKGGLVGAQRAERPPPLGALGASRSPAAAVRTETVPVQEEAYDFGGDAPTWEEEDELPKATDENVLVSIRLRPTKDLPAWAASSSTVQLASSHATRSTHSQEWRFDQVLSEGGNADVYRQAARGHVRSAMDGLNAVIFAYGQTASGKTHTLSGTPKEPGVIPRAVDDVFEYIKKNPSREFLLRVAYVEIYNEQIHDLLSPTPTTLELRTALDPRTRKPLVVLTPLHEEVCTSPEAVRELLRRGTERRHTSETDWNARSSRSHVVFQLTIESCDRGRGPERVNSPAPCAVPQTQGGIRLRGNAVRTSTLSLIDLAGSEKATSQVERRLEGANINKSLLTLGMVIQKLVESGRKGGKSGHVPYRDSKLTRLLEPSLSGNARVSVICTLNPSHSQIDESVSTLQFASRVKKVELRAERGEVVDAGALLEVYKREIENLRRALREKEDGGGKADEGKGPGRGGKKRTEEEDALEGLRGRIEQLTKLILHSSSVDEQANQVNGRPVSPSKARASLPVSYLPSAFPPPTPTLPPSEELFHLRRSNADLRARISELEAAVPSLPADAPESDKDRRIRELEMENRGLKIVVKELEEMKVGEALRETREDVEREWKAGVDALRRELEDKKAWAQELLKGLEKEKRVNRDLQLLALSNMNQLLTPSAPRTSASRTAAAAHFPTSPTRRRSYSISSPDASLPSAPRAMSLTAETPDPATWRPRQSVWGADEDDARAESEAWDSPRRPGRRESAAGDLMGFDDVVEGWMGAEKARMPKVEE